MKNLILIAILDLIIKWLVILAILYPIVRWLIHYFFKI